MALSKLYELDDRRLAELQVQGDLIVPKSDRIVTRSRAKQIPHQYTIISAQLKIIKVLVEELLSASGNSRQGDLTAAVDSDDGDDDDDDWEDETNEFLDLGSGMTKSQLMAYGADDSNSYTRSRDDETQAYLLNFFRQQAQKPSFNQVFEALTPEEQEKLRSMNT